MCKSDDEVYELTGARVIRRTAKALMVLAHGERFWIPRSVVDEEFQGSLLIKFWWMEKSGALRRVEATQSIFKAQGNATIAALAGSLKTAQASTDKPTAWSSRRQARDSLAAKIEALELA